MINDIDDIMHLRGSNELTEEIVAQVKRSIAERSLEESLNVDTFPLSLEQYKVITSNFINDMDWEKMMLLFKIGMFVDVNERDELVRHLTDTYCPWIIGHGGLSRCLSKSCWERIGQRSRWAGR